jgi:hypothetical protein
MLNTRKIILVIIILAIIVGAAGFWYWQRNPYSKEILKLEILGPEETDLSQEVEYIIKYKNNGNVRLEEPRLAFELPEHTLLPVLIISEAGEEEGFLRRQEFGPEDLGDIYPGEEKIIRVKARLFGKEGETKTAKAWLSYQPKNLKARYESATTFTTAIKSVPLTFDFDLPSKVETGRDFKFYLNYFSSLDYPLTNIGVKVDYPSGFEFLESEPQSLGKTEWETPLLNKTEGGRIEIQGRLVGEVREQKIFKAFLGVWQNDEFIPLKEITKGVEITKPHIFVFQRINDSDEYIANPGDLLHYEIFFRNIGEEPFKDLFLVAELEGKAFDLGSLRSEFGQFNEGGGSVVWDWRDVPELRFLGQGEEGKVEFWISLKGEWEVSSPQDKNFVLENNVLISQVKEKFTTKINSKLVISQKGYFQDNTFENSGPIPPKVGKATTYTIIWQAKNYYNDLRDVKVRAILPSSVSLTGKISPEEESSNFSFDNQSREIVWTVRDNEIMTAGTGVSGSAPTIAFQVALTPTSEQKGKTPQIINEARIRGEDLWTGNIIEGMDLGVDATLPDDPSVSSEQGIVE